MSGRAISERGFAGYDRGFIDQLLPSAAQCHEILVPIDEIKGANIAVLGAPLVKETPLAPLESALELDRQTRIPDRCGRQPCAQSSLLSPQPRGRHFR